MHGELLLLFQAVHAAAQAAGVSRVSMPMYRSLWWYAVSCSTW
jgi:hypothetical protein